MKENSSVQPVSNGADANGLNVLDRQKRQHFSHQALERYPLMPSWRVYRISYWSTPQNIRTENEAEVVK